MVLPVAPWIEFSESTLNFISLKQGYFLFKKCTLLENDAIHVKGNYPVMAATYGLLQIFSVN